MTLRETFLLDPAFAFLNHGSFGATPKPVFEAYQRWQRELEQQPVKFYQRTLNPALEDVREVMAHYLNVNAPDLHFVRNATVGINYIARSIALAPGDEVLTTNHEYGAMDATWQFVCDGAGARYVVQPIPLPYTTDAAFMDALWAGVTERTRVIFLSHITSPTAICFPVAEVCRRAREQGILTVIDGAHAPGQVPLDVSAIGADYYTGNFHKWLCAPKSAGFLHAQAEHQAGLYPLIVSWGWVNGETPTARLQWRGTEDAAAYLALPEAVRFQDEHDWPTVRAQCHTLAVEARERLMALFDLPATSPHDNFAQMFTASLPPCNPATVGDVLHFTDHIEVPIIAWGGRQFVRVSVQGYNTADDLSRLLEGLARIFDGQTSPAGP